MKRKSRKRRIIIWAVVIVAVVIIAAMWLGSQQSAQGAYTEETVKTQDIRTYLSFSGHVRAAEEKQQTAKQSMKVKELLVKEGDRVESGQLLMKTANGERVYANIAGIIEKLYPEIDSQLSPGSPIADIVNYGDLLVKVDADEYDVGALSVGQAVSIYVNALSATAEGVVDKIANDATVGKDVSYYEVEITLTGDTGALRAGMSVEAQVLNRTAEGAVTISMKALQFDSENQPFVYMKNSGGQIVAQYVTVGINDGTTVQILTGAQSGETVFVPVSNSVVMPGMAIMRSR